MDKDVLYVGDEKSYFLPVTESLQRLGLTVDIGITYHMADALLTNRAYEIVVVSPFNLPPGETFISRDEFKALQSYSDVFGAKLVTSLANKEYELNKDIFIDLVEDSFKHLFRRSVYKEQDIHAYLGKSSCSVQDLTSVVLSQFRTRGTLREIYNAPRQEIK